MGARRWIKKNRENGRRVSENLTAIKKTAATVLFLCGTTRQGKGIISNVKDNFNTHQVKEAESKVKVEEANHEMVSQHDDVLALEIPPLPGQLLSSSRF